MQIHERLRMLREENEYTQEQVAEYINTHKVYYNRYERGAHPIPFDRMCDLADLYNVSLDWIAGRTTKREINY